MNLRQVGHGHGVRVIASALHGQSWQGKGRIRLQGVRMLCPARHDQRCRKQLRVSEGNFHSPRGAHAQAAYEGVLPFVRQREKRPCQGDQLLHDVFQVFRALGHIRVSSIVVAGHHHGQLVVVRIPDDIGKVHVIRIVPAAAVQQVQGLVLHALHIDLFAVAHNVCKGKAGKAHGDVGLHAQIFRKEIEFYYHTDTLLLKMIVTKGGPQEGGPSLYPVYSFTAPSVIPLTKYFWKNG